MASSLSPPRTWEPLPHGIVGGKVRVYQVIQVLALEQCQDRDGAEPGVIYFRRPDLASRAGLSIPQMTKILRWLSTTGYIEHVPGNPGRLSKISLLRPCTEDASGKGGAL